jgi:hypothetical protein
MSGLSDIGQDLMAKAFNLEKPRIVLTTTSAEMPGDEQVGFRFLLMGTMRLRNRGAHGFPALDQRLAADYPALVSLLLGRLHAATQPQRPVIGRPGRSAGPLVISASSPLGPTE